MLSELSKCITIGNNYSILVRVCFVNNEERLYKDYKMLDTQYPIYIIVLLKKMIIMMFI